MIEAVPQVIDWHQRHLLPLAPALTGDSRCRLVEADFFSTIADGAPLRPGAPERVHAVIVDIDHTPRHHLHPSHAAFYTPEGQENVAARLHLGGVFALWSDDPPDNGFVEVAAGAFASCEAHVVTFPNPLTGRQAASNTVYVARIDNE